MKNNKLLAEYLELEMTVGFTPDTDWNDIMKVIEKIRKELNDKYSPCRRYDLHDIFTMLANSFIGKCDYTIEDIRNACVEYIKSK